MRAVRLPALLTLALLASACSSSPDPSLGAITSTGSTRTITVPALWAGADSAGNAVGGIEPAEIKVSDAGGAGFRLDLTTIEAEGAQAQWQAATAAAASTAVLISRLDPSRVSYDFSVSGPIDGPSAGAILTAGSLAALWAPAADNSRGFAPGVTMTGTITPDGSIGAVSGVSAKIKAAHEAGFTTVLIPAASTQEVDPTTRALIDLVAYGRDLGVDVIPVTRIEQALDHLGVEQPTIPPQAYSPGPVTESAARDLAATMLDRVTGQTATPAGQALAESSALQSLLDEAAALHEAGDEAGSYARSALAGVILAREAAREEVSARPTTLRPRVEEVLDQAERSLDAAAARPWADAAALASAPAALALPAHAIAWARSALAGLDSFSEAALGVAARDLGEQEFILSALLPDALTMIDAASPSASSAGAFEPSDAATFLSGYTPALVESGRAGEDYLAQALGMAPAVDGSSDARGRMGTIAELGEVARATPDGVQSVPEELQQSAWALSYAMTTAEVVAEVGAYGDGEDGIDDDVVNLAHVDVAQQASAATGEAAAAQAGILQSTGQDAPLLWWSATLGVALASIDSDLAGNAALLGFSEASHAFVGLSMLTALTES